MCFQNTETRFDPLQCKYLKLEMYLYGSNEICGTVAQYTIFVVCGINVSSSKRICREIKYDFRFEKKIRWRDTR